MSNRLLERAKSAYPSFAMSVIVIVLALQTIAIIKPIRWTIWPFTNYPMYKTPHFDGDPINVTIRVIAELEDGSSVEIYPSDVGLNFFKFYEHGNCIIPHANCPEPNSYTARLREMYESRSGNKVTKLTAMSYPAIITREGVAEVESEVRGYVSFFGDQLFYGDKRLTYNDREWAAND